MTEVDFSGKILFALKWARRAQMSQNIILKFCHYIAGSKLKELTILYFVLPVQAWS